MPPLTPDAELFKKEFEKAQESNKGAAGAQPADAKKDAEPAAKADDNKDAAPAAQADDNKDDKDGKSA